MERERTCAVVDPQSGELKAPGLTAFDREHELIEGLAAGPRRDPDGRRGEHSAIAMRQVHRALIQ
jgi:hypothetical protein